MGYRAKIGQLLRALASYSPLRLVRWVFLRDNGSENNRFKRAAILQRAAAMASPFLLEEFESRRLLSTVFLSENFDGSGYTTNSSRYNVAIVSKLSTDTHNTATTDGYLPQSDGSDIVVSLSCAAADTGGSCGVASGDYNLQFDLYAMDNMNADGSIGNGAYSVTAVNVDTGATIDTVAGNLSDLTPTAANVNGTYTGDTSSYTAGTWPTYDTTGCGPGCCSATAPYVEDPDYDMTIPLHLENASQINIHINVTGMNGTYAAGQFAVDNIILSGDLTVTQASTRPTSNTGALVTWQSDPYATAYVVSASTDGTDFTPVGYANPGDTGMLLTNLTAGGSYTFEIDAFTADGTNDAEATTGTITLSGGTPGVYTVTSSDGLAVHRDAGAAPGVSSSMDILNDTVAAGSAEEAVLLSLDPNGSVVSCGAGGETNTPLSGALGYFGDYVTADAGDLGAAGTDVGSAIGVAEGWRPGDDFTSFDFHDDFMLVSVTKVADYNVVVETGNSVAATDTGADASFIITREGDISSGADVYFNMTADSTVATPAVEGTDYQMQDADGDALPTDGSGDDYVAFAAGQSQAVVYLHPLTPTSPSPTPTDGQAITLNLISAPTGSGSGGADESYDDGAAYADAEDLAAADYPYTLSSDKCSISPLVLPDAPQTQASGTATGPTTAAATMTATPPLVTIKQMPNSASIYFIYNGTGTPYFYQTVQITAVVGSVPAQETTDHNGHDPTTGPVGDNLSGDATKPYATNLSGKGHDGVRDSGAYGPNSGLGKPGNVMYDTVGFPGYADNFQGTKTFVTTIQVNSVLEYTINWHVTKDATGKITLTVDSTTP